MRIQRGFTLIELLVVIAIIGILATLVITQLSGAQSRARNSNAKSDVSQMGKAVETWKTTNNLENVVNSDAVLAGAPGTRLNNVTVVGVWGTVFNNAAAATATTYAPYAIRVSKTPSASHTYGYTTSAVTTPGSLVFAEVTSASYCIGTSVTDSTAAPDGAFYILNGASVSKTAGTTAPTYATGSCS